MRDKTTWSTAFETCTFTPTFGVQFYYAHGIAPKYVMTGRVYLCGLAPGQHSFEETSQQKRAVGDIVFDLMTRDSNPKPPTPITMFNFIMNPEIF